MSQVLKNTAYGTTKEMPIEKAIGLLDQFAERIYIDPNDPWAEALAPLLNQRIGNERVGIMDRDRFINMLRPRRTRYHLSFSGQCKSRAQRLLKRQKTFIEKVIVGLGDYTDAIVHGATMWSFIKDVHELAVANKKISIGIMPRLGLFDLAQIADQLPKDFPKMHYLGIEGSDYLGHVDLFGAIPSGANEGVSIVIGGRDGAEAEANACRMRNKFVVCYPIEDHSEAIDGLIEKETLVLTEPNRVINFLKANATPGQRLFYGKMPTFDAFYNHLNDNRIVNIGFVSTSGAFTNYPYFRVVLEKMLAWGLPKHLMDRIECTSGGTKYGGVWEMYEVAELQRLVTNGLMCAKGTELPWASCDKMFYVGEDWGDESNCFTKTADILLAFVGGGQAKTEIIEAAKNGGRIAHKPGVPVIVLHDDYTAGATHDLYRNRTEFNHPNIHFFDTKDLQQAAKFMYKTIEDIAS